MYIGYFILRSALEVDKRKLYSAVLGVIAYLDVPIVYYAVDIWQSGLHPDRGTKWSLETTMRHTWMVALLGTNDVVYTPTHRAVSHEKSAGAL